MIKKISKTKHSEAPVKSDNEFPVVGIGASAGGLEAFKKLLKAIPEESGMAYVLVQHLDPTHASLLPELLQKVTQIPVLEISDDIKVEPNHIYVIPSNKMMVATDGVLLLTPRPASTKNNRNLPIDLFFNSLAEVHQAHAIGVVLSGTASDGTAGLRAIKDYGGLTFAQDDKSAAYDSMPNSAVHAGVVDFVLPPEQIPAKILEVHKSISKIGGNETSFPRGQEEVFKQIISQLRIRKGTDFTYYKPNTIQRRILRRMVLNKNSDPAEYLKFLKDNKPEQDILYQDMLIPVTAFFRDPKVFENLTESVLPQIIKNKGDNDPIRVWVAGCSTGEEAYSIAICLNEFLGERTDKIQIFATDISEPAITKARSGVYSNADIINISPARLNEFFIKSSTGYTLKKSVRDSCVFALHNFIKDPPFGKMDLITCRNVLIYMQPYLQKKALTTFHYSLKPKGFLFLGKTESVNAVPEFFATIDKSDKIFSNKVTMGRNMMEVSSHAEQKLSPADPVVNQEVLRTDFQKTADDLMLSKYTPAGVVVDQALDIVHFRGNTANYLEQSSGKPSHNILKMAKNALAFDLRNILHKLKKENTTVIKENIPLEFSGSIHQITIEGMPLSNTVEPYYLILFHDNTLGIPLPASAARKKKTKELLVKDAKDLRIEQLEQELSRTREDVMSIAEDQESTNEELQSDNEELMSSSEELQSLNEELETSKEELQSTNEELTVVNQEIISLNEQVTEARDYAEAIVDTVGEPLLVIDKRLRIKTANSAFYQTFRTLETETEGKYIFEMDEGQWDIPELRNALEKILKEKSVIKDLEITYKLKKTGERYLLLNARQLNITSNSEELILLAIQDITISKKVQEQQRQIEKRFQFIADAMPQKVWTADHDGNYNYFNKNWLDYTGLSFEEMKDKVWKKLIHPDDWEEHKKQWQHSIDTGKDFEVEHRFLDKDGKYHWHLSHSLAYKDKNGKIVMWVGTNTGIEEQKKRKEDLAKACSSEFIFSNSIFLSSSDSLATRSS